MYRLYTVYRCIAAYYTVLYSCCIGAIQRDRATSLYSVFGCIPCCIRGRHGDGATAASKAASRRLTARKQLLFGSPLVPQATFHFSQLAASWEPPACLPAFLPAASRLPIWGAAAIQRGHCCIDGCIKSCCISCIKAYTADSPCFAV